MSDMVEFYFDPLCPWAWQGAVWIRQVASVRDIRVEWRLFSLFLINEHREEFGPEVRDEMLSPLRVLALVRRDGGNEALGRAYQGIGERLHEQRPKPEMSLALLQEAIRAVGLDPALVDRAAADPSTEEEVVAEHESIVKRVGAFGVPTIVLPSGKGIFGPVKAVAALGESAGELWDHFRWLAEQEDFFELKRIRDRKPGRAA
jgi:protein-disulfide isomerase-like protein with CxxC motif